MATVFASFDDEGELLSTFVFPESVDLATVRHFTGYSYATHIEDADVNEQSIDEALEVLAQAHALDVKNGVKP